MSEENKAIVRHFIQEVLNEGNLEMIDELIAPEFVRHDPSTPEEMRGPQDASHDRLTKDENPPA